MNVIGTILLAGSLTFFTAQTRSDGYKDGWNSCTEATIEILQKKSETLKNEVGMESNIVSEQSTSK